MRLFYLWEIWETDAFAVLVSDAKAYDDWARRIIAGDWLGSEIFYQAPLYPYLLAVIYKLIGVGHGAARVVQAVAGASACVLVAGAGSRFFGKRVGLMAGVFMAMQPTAIFFDGLIQKASLAFLLTASLLFVLGGVISRQSSNCRWLGIGVVLGLLVLSRENALVLVLPCLLWIVFRWGRNLWPDVVVRLSLFVLGITMVLMPVGFRNLTVGGEFTLTTSQFGPNFYIGNRPGAKGTYAPLVPGRGDPSSERKDATLLAEQAVGRTLSPLEVSEYWTEKTLGHIAENPVDWLFLMGRKAALILSRFEEGDTEDQYTFGDWSISLRWLTIVFHFGVLMPLAVFGIVMSWRWRRRVWVLYAFLMVYASSVVIFFVFSRYRFPLVPVLVIFSAFGFSRGLQFVRRRRYKRLLWPTLAAFAAAVAANVATTPDLIGAKANMLYNIGFGLSSQNGRAEDAIGYYKEAIRLKPEFFLPYMGIGEVLRQLGRPSEAETYFLRTLDLQPESPDAYVSLGTCFMDMGRYAEASFAFRYALTKDPSLEYARYQMGVALRQLKQMKIKE